MTTGWTRQRVLVIACGGAVGASTRWTVLEFATVSPTWPVFVLNVTGSFVLGVVVAEEWRNQRGHTLMRDFAGIGFCGGLTTFSTLAVEAATLLRDGKAVFAIGYLLVSGVASLFAAFAGAAALHRVRALQAPLE